MKIPKKIKAFGFVYPVIQKKNLRDKEGKWLGLIAHKEGEIKLDKNQHHRRKEQVLLHELVHFVNAEERIKMKERDVEKLSTGLYQILKDNNIWK